MATRAITVRDAIVTQLLKIGVDPASGWESGPGAPAVTAGHPKRDPIAVTPERQIWVQYVGRMPLADGSTGPSHTHRGRYRVWILCPDPATGEDLATKLERDVLRAVQLNEASLLAASNLGVWDGGSEVDDQLLDAGIWNIQLLLTADWISDHNDP